MRFRLRSTGGPDRDGGSMVVVITIILVVTLLGSMILARSIGAAFISSGQQSAAAALGQADAGLADALYRIDQGAGGTGTGTAFCVEAANADCLASTVPAAPGASYLATKVSGTDWLVQALATVNGLTAAVEAHVTRLQAYPFALFGATSLDFNGGSAQTFAGYSSAEPAGSGSGQPNPDPQSAVSVGSNGAITCSSSLGVNVTVQYYGSGSVSSTGTSSCGTYQRSKNRYYLPSPVPPASAGACPGAGVGGADFGSGISGAPGTLAAGTYVCTTPITVSGILDVSGPVLLYVDLSSSAYGPGSPAITITPGSYVNDQADYCANGGSSGCSSVPNLPDSQDLELFVDGTGQFGVTSGSAFYLGGIVYAPHVSLMGDACSSHYYGSVVVNSLDCRGGPALDISYDTGLADVYGPWTEGSYTQIDPAAFYAAMTASGF